MFSRIIASGRLLQRHARLELPLKHKELLVYSWIRAVEHDRPPQIGTELREPLRHDSNERRRNPVQDICAAENGRVAIVSADPRLVGHHKDGRRTGRGISRRERPTKQCRHSEKLEHVRCRPTAGELLGAFSGRYQHVFVRAANHVIEHVVLRLELEELRQLEERASAGPAAGRIVNLNHGDTTGVGVRKRIEQDVLNDAEDGGRGANAKRQIENR